MFDRYLLNEDSLRNVEENGTVIGWAVDARIGYYRGLGLSMVDVELTLDGVDVDRDAIRLQLHGKDYRLTEIADVFDDRWGFSESVTLLVELPGGLSKGEHTVALTQRLRISYLPVPSVNKDSKVLKIA